MLPYVDIGRGARLKNVVIDRGVQHPGRPRGRRGSRARRQALPPHREGHLPDHPADDRPAGQPDAMRVLSVASEVFPLIKTGGLADVAGALPAALAPHGVDAAHAAARLSRRDGRARRREAVATLADLFGGPARLLARPRPPASTSSSSTRRTSSTAPAIPISAPTASDWPDNCAPLRARSPRRRRHRPRASSPASRPTSSTPMTGRRPGARLSRLRRRRAAATVMTIHNLAFQGQFPPAMLRRARPAAATPSRSTGVEYYGGVGFLKAGLHFADRDHHGQPDLCRRRSGRGRFGMGLDGLLARARADAAPASSTASTTTVWNPATDPQLAAHLRREDARRPRPTTRRARGALRPRRRRRAAVLRRQPAHLAEGHGHPRRGARRPRRRRRQARACSAPATARWRRRFRAARRRHPRPRRRRHRL